MALVLLSLACAAVGLTGHRWLAGLVNRRARRPLNRSQARWVSAPVVTSISTLAALLWLVEAPMAVRIGLMISGILGAYLGCIDIALHKLPDPLVAAHGGAVAAGLLSAYLLDQIAETTLWHAMVGGGAGFLLLFALALIGGRSLGFGDVKLAGMLGMMTGAFGPTAFGQWIMLSFIAGGLFAGALLVTGKMGPKDAIAFGPWLILGAYLAVALNTVPHL